MAFGSLDIDGWVRGLVGALISGGASAVSGAIVLPALDSDHFNIYHGAYYIAIFALFLSSGMVSMFKFLAVSPLPPQKLVTTTVQTTVEKPKATVVTTVEEVKSVPAVESTIPPK